MNWLDEVNWSGDGLVPVIAQESGSGKVLMFAWMNREALDQTARTGEAVYWSRSRKRLWRKGEESGHVQAAGACQIIPAPAVLCAQLRHARRDPGKCQHAHDDLGPARRLELPMGQQREIAGAQLLLALHAQRRPPPAGQRQRGQ